jgi:hypothetical protein
MDVAEWVEVMVATLRIALTGGNAAARPTGRPQRRGLQAV